MGRTLIAAVLEAPDLTLAAALDAPASLALGSDAGQCAGLTTCGITVTADYRQAIAAADCLVDFTRPAATLAYLEACVESRTAAVIGTTGFDEAGKRAIAAAAERIPLAIAPNFAVGVNVLYQLAEMAARMLGDDYDVEIIEAHHRHKADAPSGTALRIGEVVARALGRDLPGAAVHGRHGDTGVRDPKSIGFHAIRGGDIVGEHTVMFAGLGERVEVTVRSASRNTYAAGALRAARFVSGRAPGLYDMRDVLAVR